MEVTKADLARVLTDLSSPRLLVVGDLMLDRYTWGNADRLSQEAPVAVLRANRCEERMGGAANVCHMVHALQGGVTCAGVVAADRAGHQLTALLFEAGMDCGLILVDPARPPGVATEVVEVVDQLGSALALPRRVFHGV